MATQFIKASVITLCFTLAACGGGGSSGGASSTSDMQLPADTAASSTTASPAPATATALPPSPTPAASTTPTSTTAPIPSSTPTPIPSPTPAIPTPTPSPLPPTTPSTSPADATHARFSSPQGIARSASGDLYIADTGNRTIRKIAQNGEVSTLAGTTGVTGSTDGIGGTALFTEPTSIAVDTNGNVYVADGTTIRKITPARAVTTLAGVQGQYGIADGLGSSARFYHPAGITVDSFGNLFITDASDAALNIRKVTPDGVVSTLAGGATSVQSPLDGNGTQATFIGPTAITIDGAGNLYLTDVGIGGLTTPNLYDGATLIRKITPTVAVTTIGGNAGFVGIPNDGNVAQFSRSNGIALDSLGNIFVLDHFNGGNRILKRDTAGGVTELPIDASAFGHLSGLTIDATGNLYVSDDGNHAIYKISPSGTVVVYAGKSGEAGSTDAP